MNPLERYVRRTGGQVRNWEPPSWWTLFQVGACAVLALVVVYKLIAPEPASDTTLTNRFVSQAQNATRPTDTAVQPGETKGTVEVAYSAGGTASIDAAALDAATRATTAKFTGDFSGVPVLSGVSIPVLVATYPSVLVVKTTLLSDDGEAVTFTYVLRVPGESTLRTITTTVVRSGSTWYWAGM